MSGYRRSVVCHQEDSSYSHPTAMALWPWTSRLQNCKKETPAVQKPPRTLLQQPDLTHSFWGGYSPGSEVIALSFRIKTCQSLVGQGATSWSCLNPTPYTHSGSYVHRVLCHPETITSQMAPEFRAWSGQVSTSLSARFPMSHTPKLIHL